MIFIAPKAWMTGPSLVVTMGMRGFVQPALAGITPMRPK